MNIELPCSWWLEIWLVDDGAGLRAGGAIPNSSHLPK